MVCPRRLPKIIICHRRYLPMKRLKPFVCSHIHVVVIFFICCLLLLNTSIVDAKIVFCIENDIYVMNDDGSSRRQLTKTQYQETRSLTGRLMAKQSPLVDDWEGANPRMSCLP